MDKKKYLIFARGDGGEPILNLIEVKNDEAAELAAANLALTIKEPNPFYWFMEKEMK